MTCISSITEQINNDSCRILVEITPTIPSANKITVSDVMKYCGQYSSYDATTIVHTTQHGETWYRCKISDDFPLVYPSSFDPDGTKPKTLKALAREPWNYQKPDTNSSDTLMYLIQRMSPQDMFNLSKWVPGTSDEDSKLNINMENMKLHREDISLVNFRPGDFKVYPYLYVTVYDSRVYSIFIVLETLLNMWMRTCSKIGVNSVNRDYVPTVYSNGDTNCQDLMTCVCISDPNKTYASDPICGCYQYYVDNYAVKDKKLADYLKKSGVSLPPACSSGCTLGKAYIPPDLKSCSFVVCDVDFGASGDLSGGVTIKQNCGSTPTPSPTSLPKSSTVPSSTTSDPTADSTSPDLEGESSIDEIIDEIKTQQPRVVMFEILLLIVVICLVCCCFFSCCRK
ncbi:hypothetical protein YASMINEVIRUS_46 [Yasminevirus sp. GU-2018]|uniref:Uncharacterized protein n=1 Tax=Yasminevirus sp. GU-2018 TaxID=2420051 RepID=A0A5K0U8D5_9VIRU|nr:hypothetical protein YASMINEVIRUS_46 [Yasminevirus sp. GU-2018]